MTSRRINYINPKSQRMGEDLREFRLQALMKQREFAEILGVTTATVIHWEKGRHKPSALNLVRINNCLERYWVQKDMREGEPEESPEFMEQLEKISKE